MSKTTHHDGDRPLYLDPDQPFERRADDLIGRMTLEEKVSQLVNASPAIERLGIPEYEWWNECLHGVARAGRATVFPQAIGLAATFDTEKMFRVADAISDEARAKHHQAVRRGSRKRFQGLTFYSPNVNIFRDPRWGRGQETYGECPYLSSRMGVAFVKGLQGDNPKYLKASACAKHYAVHSGPESQRHTFDAIADERDLHATYLPAFHALVCEADVEEVMTAYNRTNGCACSAHRRLIREILRGRWGFKGHVVSDAGAVADIHANHKIVDTPEEAAALALKAGCDMNLGDVYLRLPKAVERGLIDEETIDRSLRRLLMTRLRLGMFDPPESVPYAQIAVEVVDCDAHRRLAREMAAESVVLLKNEGGLLPLSKDLNAITVVGPNADSMDVLLGNYCGLSRRMVTVLEGIVGKVSPGTAVNFVRGCDLVNGSPNGIGTATWVADGSDVIVAVMGISPRIEGEENAADYSDTGGDRLSLDLPGAQEDLLRQMHAAGIPVVLLLMGGSPIAVNWADENIPAIVMCWYPGEEGGGGVADVLFGDADPAGRLPVTFVKSVDDLPPFEDYGMAGRTYRYQESEPLYPFGFGLSYTTFAYANLTLSSRRLQAGEPLEVSVDVTNTGTRGGDEVVQLYLCDLEASAPVPLRSLQGFQRITLVAGQTETVDFTLTPRQMAMIDDAGRAVLEPGRFAISLGGCQPGRKKTPETTMVLTDTFEVTGEPMELPY